MTDLVSKSSVLDIYAELYDVFDDNKAIQEELHKVYVKLRELEEQKPVAPRKVRRYIEYSDTAVNFINTYDCGNCGEELPDNAKYCPACGRAVKWDE